MIHALVFCGSSTFEMWNAVTHQQPDISIWCIYVLLSNDGAVAHSMHRLHARCNSFTERTSVDQLQLVMNAIGNFLYMQLHTASSSLTGGA